MAKKVESGAPTYLSHDPFGPRVDAFGAAIVVKQSEAGIHGGPVDFEAVSETVQVRQSAAS